MKALLSTDTLASPRSCVSAVSHSNPAAAAAEGSTSPAELPAKIPVPFIDLSPPRVYVADAATRPTARARQRAEALQSDDARFAKFGKLQPSGLWYALFQNSEGEAQESEHAGTKVDQQILAMIESPDKVEENVAVFDITDENHSAFKHRKSKEHPAYGAFARRKLQKATVLGPYGGVTKVHGDEVDRSEERADCQFYLEVETAEGEAMFVDADKSCNHLAFCNDYRTDVDHWDDPKKQEGYCKGRNKRHNTEVLIAWKDGELFPRVFFLTTRVVQANEELMLDYGDAYWLGSDEESEPEDGDDASTTAARCSSSQSSQSLPQLSQSSSQPFGLRRRKSLPGVLARTTSGMAERERLRSELVQMRDRQRQLDEERRRLAEQIAAHELSLGLVGRQVHEKFTGHGKFRGTVIQKLSGQTSSQGTAMYKVRYEDGDRQVRSEERIVTNLVDRNQEDQDAKKKIEDLPPPSSDEEGEEGGSEEQLDDQEEATQPFVEDDESDWGGVHDQAVGSGSSNDGGGVGGRVGGPSPPAETVSRPEQDSRPQPQLHSPVS